MHHIEIPALNYVTDIPSNISELSKEQFLDFLSYYVRYASGEVTYDHFRIGLVNVFIKFREPIKKIPLSERENTLAQVYRLSELMDSFTSLKIVDGIEKRAVNVHFIKNMIPTIRTKEMVLHGPADALTDLSFIEFIDAHNLFLEYVETREEETLNKLVATIYRPQRLDYEQATRSPFFDGQRREKYNPATVEQWLPIVRSKPLLIKYAIFLFFSGCEQFLHEGEIPLGSDIIKFKNLYADSAHAKGDGTGLLGLLFSIAESQVFGSVKEVADTNLYDIMVRMYQLVNQQKELSNHTTAP
ncbi:MAG: hypothetical protein WCO63_16075 [Bacteroidota bacterium]